MNYKVVEREAFQVVGIKREVSCSGEGGSPGPGIAQFWDEANENGTVRQLLQISNGQIKGPLGITEKFNAQKNVIDYWVAIEHHGDVPAEYLSFTFPASKWVVFEVKGSIPTAMVKAWKEIQTTWFPSHDFQPAGIPPFEAYLDSDLTSPNSVNEIWFAVK